MILRYEIWSLCASLVVNLVFAALALRRAGRLRRVKALGATFEFDDPAPSQGAEEAKDI